MKATEKRAGIFEQRFGLNGGVELDALEALHPGRLEQMLEAELDNFLDRGLQRRFDRLTGGTYLSLRKIDDRVHARHRDQIEALQERFEEAVAGFDDLRADLEAWEEDATDLWATSC